ncbi:hypothetical protein COOONC_15926 [Cooperia oncophora]
MLKLVHVPQWLLLLWDICSVANAFRIHAEIVERAREGKWVPLVGGKQIDLIKIVKSTTLFGEREHFSQREAEQYCKEQGGHLASLHVDCQRKFLAELSLRVHETPQNRGFREIFVLVGLVKSGYHWTDGTPVDPLEGIEAPKDRHCYCITTTANMLLYLDTSHYTTNTLFKTKLYKKPGRRLEMVQKARELPMDVP